MIEPVTGWRLLFAFLSAAGLMACGGSTTFSEAPKPDDASADTVVQDEREAGEDAVDGGEGDAPSPETLPVRDGLLLWLRADQGVTAVAGQISVWADQSPNRYDARQAVDAAKPLWVNGGLGDLPVVRFDGNASYLSMPPGFEDFTAGVSAFVLVKPAKSSFNHAARFFDLAPMFGTLANSVLLVRFNDTDEMFFYQSYPGTLPGDYVGMEDAVKNDVWQLLEVVAQGGVAAANTTASLYKDGALLGSGRVQVPTRVVRSSNLIARSNLGASDAMLHADLAEVVLYDRALSDADRQRVEVYLKTKWNY